MDTLYTFWDNRTHYKAESVNFLARMNSATKLRIEGLNRVEGLLKLKRIMRLSTKGYKQGYYT